MRQRTRKLVGTAALILFVMVYALVVMTVAWAWLPGSSTIVEVFFFGLFGLIWVVPAGLLISWMAKPDRPSP